ncbi:hypothetical protein LP316_13945 [Thalassotalea sp. LPB0316]|uniref:DUF6436 domain-containing protein n=1 Tax=Thalassotalea sp. LPB0316 TaxID=2769490 RepID=UPI0018688456|nr:DUF6436 domain-containing protein [Thalassotalea sp. LPB0316]QOL25381.1 hypothetical protein LP316_13945 [Thalassotalea sp. LPB0316]
MLWLKQWRTSSSSPGLVHYLLVVIWLAGVLLAGYYFATQRLVEFDATGRLDKFSTSEFAGALSLSEINAKATRGKVYHFVEPNCRCNVFSKQHVDRLSVLAQAENFEIVVVSGQERLPDFVTSTPATLVLGEQNELVYFGPYAQGAFCNQASDVVELAIENYQKGYNARLVNSKAQGCYCQRT